MFKVNRIYILTLVIGLNCLPLHAAYSSSLNNLVPLTRLYRIYDDYDFIATGSDVDLAQSAYGFIWKSAVGSVVPRDASSVSQLKPIYRTYNNNATVGKTDHLFTYSESEVNLSVNTFGYRYEGIRFYCANSATGVARDSFANEINATIPLYRFWTGGSGRHYYTTNIEEGNAIVAKGGRSEGVLCYIWP